MNASRRSFFRVCDTVAITYRRVDAAQIERQLRQLEQDPADRFSLFVIYSNLSEQTRQFNRVIRHELPSVARYCDALERKLDVLAQVLVAHENGGGERHTHDVNISGGGVEFHSEEELDVDEALLLRMAFPPAGPMIIAGGRIVRSTPVPGSRSGMRAVAVEFTHIREQHREAIIRHVLRRQATGLRAQSNTPASGPGQQDRRGEAGAPDTLRA